MLALLAVAVLHLVNAERVRYHEQPLKVAAVLEHQAQAHRGTVNSSVRGCGQVWGQNVAWGTYADATPRAIVSAWMGSPAHRENLLDPAYRFTGVGVYRRGPETLVTQDFAQECN